MWNKVILYKCTDQRLVKAIISNVLSDVCCTINSKGKITKKLIARTDL